MKPSGIGGMAVMEGVMMKNKDEYAVAVRKPDKEIVVEKSTHKDFSDQVKLFKLPIFRGMLAFVDSMVVGVKVLNFSASFFEEEEETQTKKDKGKSRNKSVKSAEKKDADFEIEEVSASHKEAAKKEQKDAKTKQAEDLKKDEKSNAILMVFAVLISIVLSVTLFMVLPVFITNFFSSIIKNKFALSFIEGIIRLAIFIGYVCLSALMPDIRRVFMYHGAEHKTINCLENGFELTVENVRWQSKQHKRCGTSFMLLVVLISLVVFMAIPATGLFWRIISRVLLVPFIAGISYEFIRLAGKSESKVVNVLSQPGLWMQGLTTKEPDDSMIEVAIKSVDAVFDWRAFLNTSEAEASKDKNSQSKNSNVKNIADKQKISEKQNTVVKTSSKQEAPKASDTKETPEKKEAANAAKSGKAGSSDPGRRNTGAAPVNFKPGAPSKNEEEDDDILKALDKFFDNGNKEKAGEGK